MPNTANYHLCLLALQLDYKALHPSHVKKAPFRARRCEHVATCTLHFIATCSKPNREAVHISARIGCKQSKLSRNNRCHAQKCQLCDRTPTFLSSTLECVHLEPVPECSTPNSFPTPSFTLQPLSLFFCCRNALVLLLSMSGRVEKNRKVQLFVLFEESGRVGLIWKRCSSNEKRDPTVYSAIAMRT